MPRGGALTSSGRQLIAWCTDRTGAAAASRPGRGPTRGPRGGASARETRRLRDVRADDAAQARGGRGRGGGGGFGGTARGVHRYRRRRHRVTAPSREEEGRDRGRGKCEGRCPVFPKLLGLLHRVVVVVAHQISFGNLTNFRAQLRDNPHQPAFGPDHRRLPPGAQQEDSSGPCGGARAHAPFRGAFKGHGGGGASPRAATHFERGVPRAPSPSPLPEGSGGAPDHGPTCANRACARGALASSPGPRARARLAPRPYSRARRPAPTPSRVREPPNAAVPSRARRGTKTHDAETPRRARADLDPARRPSPLPAGHPHVAQRLDPRRRGPPDDPVQRLRDPVRANNPEGFFFSRAEKKTHERLKPSNRSRQSPLENVSSARALVTHHASPPPGIVPSSGTNADGSAGGATRCTARRPSARRMRRRRPPSRRGWGATTATGGRTSRRLAAAPRGWTSAAASTGSSAPRTLSPRRSAPPPRGRRRGVRGRDRRAAPPALTPTRRTAAARRSGRKEVRKEGRKAVKRPAARRRRGTRGIGATSAARRRAGEPSRRAAGARGVASPTSVAAGARVAHGRVVHARPFLRGGGGGGGGRKRRSRTHGSRRRRGRVVGTRGRRSRRAIPPRGSVERARSFERTFDRSFAFGGCLRARPRARVQARAVQARGPGDPLEGRPPGGRVAPEPAALLARAGRVARAEDFGPNVERLRNDFGGCSGPSRGSRRAGRPRRRDRARRRRDRARSETRRRRPTPRGFRGFGGGPNPSARPEAFRSLPKPLHREPGGHRSPPVVANGARPANSAPAAGPSARQGRAENVIPSSPPPSSPRASAGDLGARARGRRGDRAARVRRVPPRGTGTFGGDVGTAGGGGTDAEAAPEEEDVLLYDADTWLTGRRTSYGV